MRSWRIKWTGMSDPRLFDAMEAVLQAHYQVDTNSDGVQYSSWLAQALAFSGQPKYRATLEKVLATTESDKLRHHTQRALQVLPKFASWNPVIAAGVEAAPTADIPKQRASNMLKAEDPELMHAGVILVLDHFLSDAAVTDLMRDRLVARYKQADNNPALAKTLASACKVLGQTGNSSYVPTLDAVAAYTKRSTLKRWAGWAGRRLKKLNG